MVDFVTRSAEETRKLGERLSRLLRPSDVLLLHGDLGAGKTTLTQGIARGLGIDHEIQSPTFTLVNEHRGQLDNGELVTLYHIDLYRLREQTDVESFGYDDYLAPQTGITIVEWPERAVSHLPDAYLLIRLRFVADDQRAISLAAIPPHSALAERLDAFTSAGTTGHSDAGR